MEADRLFSAPGLIDALPHIWQQNVMNDLHAHAAQNKDVVVILDDTLTGTQSLQNIPVLTTRNAQSFTAEFASETNAFVVLMNTRNLSPIDAKALYRRVTHNLLEAEQQTGRGFTVISRGESNLLGHFPGDVDAVSQVLQTTYDGVLFIPALSGSYTVDDVHYIYENNADALPAVQTKYAADYAFGYQTSNLREWIEHRTRGKVPAEAVDSISIETIRQGGPQAVKDQLLQLENGRYCVVNAAHRRDLDVVALAARLAEREGKRFYYRASSEFAGAYSGIAPQPVADVKSLPMGNGVGGLVVIGSHAQRSTEQLIALLASSEVTGIEVRVESLLHDDSQRAEVMRCSEILESSLQYSDVVLYTSRRIIGADDPTHAMIVTQRVNAGLISIINGVTATPRYLAVKGSITASDIATRSLNVRRAVAMGEIVPGAPVWAIGSNKHGQRKRSFVIMPGEVGEQDTLLQLVRSLR